jgi:hypothetical protein
VLEGELELWIERFLVSGSCAWTCLGSALGFGLKGRRGRFMSLESKTSTKRDGWALGDAVLVLPTSGWSSHIGSLAIAKELHTMEEMIGKELWGRLRQGNASMFEERWLGSFPHGQPRGSMNSVQVWPHECLTYRRHIFGENVEEIVGKRKV